MSINIRFSPVPTKYVFVPVRRTGQVIPRTHRRYRISFVELAFGRTVPLCVVNVPPYERWLCRVDFPQLNNARAEAVLPWFCRRNQMTSTYCAYLSSYHPQQLNDDSNNNNYVVIIVALLHTQTTIHYSLEN